MTPRIPEIQMNISEIQKTTSSHLDISCSHFTFFFLHSISSNNSEEGHFGIAELWKPTKFGPDGHGDGGPSLRKSNRLVCGQDPDLGEQLWKTLQSLQKGTWKIMCWMFGDVWGTDESKNHLQKILLKQNAKTCKNHV